jgi:hypothetical protein
MNIGESMLCASFRMLLGAKYSSFIVPVTLSMFSCRALEMCPGAGSSDGAVAGEADVVVANSGADVLVGAGAVGTSRTTDAGAAVGVCIGSAGFPEAGAEAGAEEPVAQAGAAALCMKCFKLVIYALLQGTLPAAPTSREVDI